MAWTALALICLTGLSLEAQPMDPAAPAASYRFETAAALAEDASGHGLTATIDAGASGEGHTGLGLALDGRGGLTVSGG
ncbi:MAG: hypothetical protein FJX74_02890, partial [Armatimonadetes bacterium]|nr:hypothetical protein [Armatimonadota bacterium]